MDYLVARSYNIVASVCRKRNIFFSADGGHDIFIGTNQSLVATKLNRIKALNDSIYGMLNIKLVIFLKNGDREACHRRKTSLASLTSDKLSFRIIITKLLKNYLSSIPRFAGYKP